MKYFLLTSLLVFGQVLALGQRGPEMENGIYAHIYTNRGEIVAFLDYKNVPMTVSNFVGLAEGTIDNAAFGLGRPFYTGSKWHRVVPEHVIQGGSPNVNGRESTGYSYPNEIYEGLSHEKAGVLGIANAGPHTNGSQFYITLGDRSYLDGNYSLFGYVVKGMSIVNKITKDDVIERIEIQRIGRRAERFKPVTRTFMKMVEKAKAKVEKDAELKAKAEDLWITTQYPDAIRESNEVIQLTTVPGNGEVLKEGATVSIRYSGKVLTEELSFVSTEDEGKPLDNVDAAVFQYTIGTSKLNKGLDWVIPQMKMGEKRVIILPAAMAYGRSGFYGPYKPAHQRFVINPSARILYELEIVEISNQ